MPTRVVVRKPPQTTTAVPHQSETASIESLPDEAVTAARLADGKSPLQLRSKTPIRGVVGFRSSCRSDQKKKNGNLHLSSMDLRASPRLQGYVYMFVASVVMLVSTVKFYVDDDDTIEEIRRSLQEMNNTETTIGDEGISTRTPGTAVRTWKMYGAIVVSGVGVTISLFILMVHFDSICFPQLWKETFRDGSKRELYILLGLFIFWAAGLHICTSSFSVGEVAPNVYFTTWIAFASVPLNVGVWRKSAELPTLAEQMWGHYRETIHNWFFVLCFSLINSLAIADLYVNRKDVDYLLDGEVQQVPQYTWNRGLAISFSAVAISFTTMVCDHYLRKPYKLKTCCGTINLDWRQVEGFLALLLIGVYSWIIVEYTGVNFPLNGPSNAYFGSWGVFFSAIFTFGTWLRENKHIEVLLRGDDEDSNKAPEPESAANNNAELPR